MKMRQNQKFFHRDIFKSDAISLFIESIKIFQWRSKSKFFSFMTKVNPNNGNETISDILAWTYLNLTQHIFCQKILKYFNDFQNWKFQVLWLNWAQTMEMKQYQTFLHGTYLNLTQHIFCQKILNYFNDFQNWKFQVLWLNWAQTMEMKQNQTFFHHFSLVANY